MRSGWVRVQRAGGSPGVASHPPPGVQPHTGPPRDQSAAMVSALCGQIKGPVPSRSRPRTRRCRESPCVWPRSTRGPWHSTHGFCVALPWGSGRHPCPARALGPCVPTSSPARHWSSLSQQEPRSTGSVPSNPGSCCARPAWLGHWGECPGEGRGPRRRRLLGPGGFQQRHLESVTDHTLPGQAAVPEGLGSLATLQAAGQGERVPLWPRSPCGRAPAVGRQDG